MRISHRIPCVGMLVALAACGGGGSSLVGPIVIDFEDRPDDGFGTFAAPVAIAAGVTITDVSPAGNLEDFSTANGWGLSPCDAEAISGVMMMGASVTPGSFTITFDSAVSRVEVFANGSDGTLIELEAFGAGSAPLGLSDSQISECPSLRADDLLVVDAGGNSIVSVQIRGEYPTIDDLTYWYFD